MTSLDAKTRRVFASTKRQSCASEACFATFEATPTDEGAIRHCNRAGPDGGHAHRWDGRRWQLVAGLMQHGQG
jgi:hypothetical protein